MRLLHQAGEAIDAERRLRKVEQEGLIVLGQDGD